MHSVVDDVLAWYVHAQRPLPWRAAGVTPWGVLVSEFMCQQTQVDRVVPKWQEWMARWPCPADLAADSCAEAIRRWDRLGYPRRARWLHASATIIRDEHGGEVPSETAALRALPGIGEYTAAAVRAFAFGLPDVVLDTNVRRVIARVLTGCDGPSPHLTNDERARAASLADHDRSAQWSQAVMELGALVCTAADPACDGCPVRNECAWLRAGRPDGPGRRRQARFAGSDRQARGQIMAIVRAADAPVPVSILSGVGVDEEQRARALAGLLADGLVTRSRSGRIGLPR